MPLTWIVRGLVGLGVVVLVASAMPLAGRARSLRRALRRLSWRREDVQRLRERAEAMQETLADLAQQAALTQFGQRAGESRGSGSPGRAL